MAAPTFSDWSTLPPELLLITLRSLRTAQGLCAVSRACAAWRAAVVAEPRLIEDITRTRFPHVAELLGSLPASPCPLDWRVVYRDQLRTEGAWEPPASSLGDFVFTIAIKADGVTSVRWTGRIDPETYGDGNDSIWLWTEANAPAWAYPGPVPDGYDIAAENWHQSLPELTLSVTVSRMGANGPQSVPLCFGISGDTDEFDFGDMTLAFDSEDCGQLPARNAVRALEDKVRVLEDNEGGENTSALPVKIRPWINLQKSGGYILNDTLFREGGRQRGLSAADVLTYVSDTVPWD